MPYDWRKPNHLLTLQIGHTANDQMVFLAYTALGGERDYICVVMLVTKLSARQHVCPTFVPVAVELPLVKLEFGTYAP